MLRNSKTLKWNIGSCKAIVIAPSKPPLFLCYTPINMGEYVHEDYAGNP
jgi:hypothetical protein